MHAPLKAVSDNSLVVLGYLMQFYIDGMKARKGLAGRITDAELSILAPGPLLRSARSRYVSQLLFLWRDTH